MKRKTLLLLASIIILPISFCLGSILYNNWIESKRINDLTHRYGDELIKAVEGYESMFTLSGYVDKDEIGHYISGEYHLEVRQRLWDSVNDGESVRVATQIVSPQVVLFEGNFAEVVAEVHRQEVRYRSSRPEIINPQETVLIVNYKLQFEDGMWKVRMERNGCGLPDHRCIREMKHIEKRWYHEFFE